MATSIVELPAHTIEVVVPGTINFDQPLPEGEHERFTRMIGERFDRWFGGASATPEYGFYKGVYERTTRVWSYGALTPAKRRAVIRLAAWLRATLNQESVLIKIDGKPLLIF
ncbi:MAG: hypothetical protein IT324_30360 [Anaerolineae bacterium]|nr:hypothetical protein [Anaerolineae bacterium]